jgi:hypothetical protein
MAILELFEAEGGDRNADVLFLAADIGEAEVDEANFTLSIIFITS